MGRPPFKGQLRLIVRRVQWVQQAEQAEPALGGGSSCRSDKKASTSAVPFPYSKGRHRAALRGSPSTPAHAIGRHWLHACWYNLHSRLAFNRQLVAPLHVWQRHPWAGLPCSSQTQHTHVLHWPVLSPSPHEQKQFRRALQTSSISCLPFLAKLGSKLLPFIPIVPFIHLPCRIFRPHFQHLDSTEGMQHTFAGTCPVGVHTCWPL